MQHLIIDDAIPFLQGRLERDFYYRLMPGDKISRADLAEADGVLVRTRTRCNAELLEGTPVSFVATGTIGLDHIDTRYCDSRGIHWQNAPGCNAPAVAQYVWSALLKLGFDPASMTLGVVGKGNVGSIVGEWGRAMGVKVLVCDPPRAEKGLTDEDYLPLGQLMESVDAITFHTPLTRPAAGEKYPTLHLASAEMLAKLRSGAIIVNAARGGVVDEKALLQLKSQKNWRIAIDTWEGEPSISEDTLREADIATFHIAGYSQEGKERATLAILTGLEKHFGVTLDKSGLAAPYTPPAQLTPERILASYDIMADDATMRREYHQAADFERLRNFYPLRKETR